MHNDSQDFLNRTVNNSFVPTATSTERIDKSNTRRRKWPSICEQDNSVNLCIPDQNRRDSFSRHRDSGSMARMGQLDPKYLVRTAPPPMQRVSQLMSSAESLNETISPTIQQCLCDTSLCACQEDYLNRNTADISRITMLDASAVDPNLLANGNRQMRAYIGYNNENEPPALLENLLISDEEDGNDILNMTEYAYNYLYGRRNNVKNPAVLQAHNVQQRQVVPKVDKVTLNVNRGCVAWPGSFLRDINVKSFNLTLTSSTQKTAFLSIDQPQDVFLFSNESGSVCQQDLEVVLSPKEPRKIFIKFRPTDSSYNSGTVRIRVDDHKYKIGLFGYMDSARIQLVDFEVQPNPDCPDKKMLVRHVERPRHHSIAQSAGSGMTSINVCNVGARTAFVSLFSHQKDVTFEPRAFLVISKSTVVVKVSWTGVKESIGRRIPFMFVQADEEIRRACRQCCLEFPSKKKYDMFSTLQLFPELPEEKQIRLNEIPHIDWRPYLLLQVNNGYRECAIDLTPPVGSFGVGENESTLTIEEQTRSATTEIGSLSNLKRLQLKPVYINNVENFIHSLRDQLEGIVVLKDMIRFPVTPVSAVSHQAILIRNNNLFSVYFAIMPPSRMSSLFLPKSSDTLTSASSNGHGSQSPEDRDGIGLVKAGRPLCNSVRTIRVAFVGTVVTVRPQESLLMPVTFSPVAAGKIECMCSIKFQCHENDMFYEKEIDFSGEAVYKAERESRPTEDSTRSIPGITVISNVVEFGEIDLVRSVTRSLLVKSRFQHSKHLFISPLSPPFEFRSGGKVTLNPGKSALKIYFNPKQTSERLNEAVLLLSDEEANCTHVLLRARLKR